jgi:HK97 gp10 family phage protein
MTETVITGLADLQRVLETLPAKIEGNIMRGAVRAGVKIIKDEAKRLCPVGSSPLPAGETPGTLQDSIHISAKSKRGVVTASVKAGGGRAYYAHMVEYGTARHLIKPKNSKSLFIAGLFGEVVDHPGAQKKPFMRPALDGKSTDAIEAMANYIRDRLPIEVDKLK